MTHVHDLQDMQCEIEATQKAKEEIQSGRKALEADLRHAKEEIEAHELVSRSALYTLCTYLGLWRCLCVFVIVFVGYRHSNYVCVHM